MRKSGRIVNVSSQSGQIKYFHPRLQARFSSPALTLAELDALVGEYSRSADQHNETASGWPPLAHYTSKAAVNAATRILARENPDLLVNCCCPGWVGTPLGAQAGQPPKSVEEGAKIIPLRLAIGVFNKWKRFFFIQHPALPFWGAVSHGTWVNATKVDAENPTVRIPFVRRL